METTIVHLGTTHKAFDHRIFHKESKTLAVNGYPVKIMVPHDRDETVDGIEILSVPIPATGKERMFKTTKNIYDRILKQIPKENTILHFHDYDLLPYMFKLKKKGYRIIYDVHEDMPRLIKIQHWLPEWIKPFASTYLSWLEFKASRKFDGFIPATDVIAKRFPTNKSVTVKNYPIILPPPKVHKRSIEGVVYAGVITRQKGAVEMLEAVSRFNRKHKKEVKLHLIGTTFPSVLEGELKEMDRDNVLVFHGWQSQAYIHEFTAKCIAGLVLIHMLPQYTEALPTKLFEYMNAELPVIASFTPVMKTIIDKAQCGYYVDPKNVDDIVRAIEKVASDEDKALEMGKNGYQSARDEYNWENEAEKLLRFYNKIA